MENINQNGQSVSTDYDFRLYDQVWQRVTPGVDPYGENSLSAPNASLPDAGSAAPAVSQAKAAAAPSPVVSAAPAENANAAAMPGAEQNPCCMGTNAQESVMVLEGFVEEERMGRRCCLTLANQVRGQRGSNLAQLMRRIAGEKQAAVQELCAAYYLITGRRYTASLTVEHMHWGSLPEMLRACYHQEACAGMNYQRAAEETLDPCLQKLLKRLGDQSYQRAEDIMALLGRMVC